MKVAFDISPIQSGHQVRGIGSYTKNLYEQFLKNKDEEIEFEFFNKQLQRQDNHIIHYPYFDLFFNTLRPSKTAKTVVTIHDVIPLVFPEHFPVGIRGYINLFFQKRALKKCSAIICDSKTSKADIIQKLSIEESKIKVIYLAPGAKFKVVKVNLPMLQKKYAIPTKFILYVGDVNWNKNLNNLLEAASLSKKNLVLVGKALTDDKLAETQEINKKIKSLKLQDKIVKVGFIPDEDLVRLYNAADVTLLPSFYEGFGLPVLESMACGTPVICSNTSSISEIAGKDAIFCDPSDPSDIASKIKNVFEMSQLDRDLLSKKLIKHAGSFSWDKVAKQTIDVYKSL